MSKTIYEKFRAGAAISDSELNTCGENAIDVIRFLEKELRVVSGQYNQVVQQNKDLQKELNRYKKVQNKKIDLILFKCAHILTFNDTAIIKPMVFDIQETAKELKGG